MENKAFSSSLKRGTNEKLLPLAVKLASKPVSGFDNTECGSTVNCQTPSTNNPSPREHLKSIVAPEFTSTQCQTNEGGVHPLVQLTSNDQSHSISITMPASPSEHHLEQAGKTVGGIDKAITSPRNEQPNHAEFTTMSIPEVTSYDKEARDEKVCDSSQPRVSRSHKLNDKRYDSFKTWSSKLERRLSSLRGKQQKLDEDEAHHSQFTESAAVPAISRYFDALEGPELDTLRASEVLALPEDWKWPFLLRFPISSFGMCLGASSQAILWKTLATASSMRFLHVNLTVNLILWCMSLALMCTVSIIYSLKVIFYFEAVKREYNHPVRVNFFFAPWIACLFLAIGVPPSVTEHLHGAIWHILMAPILCLELKIYGQWMSGSQRRLSKVANPSNHLSIVGNFVLALLGASMGLKEGPIFFFAVGLAHYSVLFVTLYQRLPTNKTLPKELHPVFFLFVAAPSVACMAWANIRGDFDNLSRIAYFVALFLYVSLVVRINFFLGFRFSLAWWAYTFPMTGVAIATIRYSNVVDNMSTRILSMALSSISTFTVTALLIATLIHAFVLHDLFPNDVAIAITEKRPKWSKKRSYLEPIRSGIKDLQASVTEETPSN